MSGLRKKNPGTHCGTADGDSAAFAGFNDECDTEAASGHVIKDFLIMATLR